MSERPAVAVEPDAGAMIVVEGLTKRYGATRALDGLSMSVERGTIYGFVGPNGAGKTTTLRILATLLAADSGRAVVVGEDVRRHPTRVRAVLGYMPDFFGVYDDLTVQEYLEFYAASYGVPAKRRRSTIDELLELVDLQDKRYSYVEGLSRGMKQRLGLARCLVHDPYVLLLDEPASGMDPRARYEMREIVKELQRIGKTVLISSHILLELAEMCTHIGIIQAGRLVRQGPVEHVLHGRNPGRAYAVRVLRERAKLEAILAANPDVSEVLSEEEGLDGTAGDRGPALTIFRTFADDDALGEILRVLVEADLGVIEFGPYRENLEDVFMQLTAEQPATVEIPA